ncbi:MAG: hypothetical protein K8T90_17755 [Planctomycetes bacterium]|nr:hypothetical protein [Planctomycetota bacterium]
MRIRPVARFVPFAALTLLGGCSTVRGWRHLAPDEEPAAATVVSKEVAPKDVAAQPAPRRDVRALPSEAIRLEIRAVEKDTVDGKVSLKDSRKRLAKLRDDLDVALRAEAKAGPAGRPAVGAGLERDEALGARLDAVLSRLEAIERRLDAIESK